MILLLAGCEVQGTLVHNSSVSTEVDCKTYCQAQFRTYNCSEYEYVYNPCHCDCTVWGCLT
jgi:hypothetical protein